MAVRFVFVALLAIALGVPPSAQDSTTAPTGKQLYEALKTGNQECLTENKYIVCLGICLSFTQLGILDKDGGYVEVESRMIDFVANSGGQNLEKTNQTATACQSVSIGETGTGCERARRVFKCLTERLEKKLSMFELMMAGNRLCTENKNNFFMCHSLCTTLKISGIIDTDDKFVESQMVEIMKYAGEPDQQSTEMVKNCNSDKTVNGPTEKGCERAQRVIKCITDEKLKTTGEQIKS